MIIKVITVQREAARRLAEIARGEGQPVDEFLEAIAQAVRRPETPADAPPEQATPVRAWARSDGMNVPPGSTTPVAAESHADMATERYADPSDVAPARADGS